MTCFHKNPFLLALALSLLVFGRATIHVTAVGNNDTDKTCVWPRQTVEVINLLPDKADYTIRCKSKDDDLGLHVIKAGQRYSFSFKSDYFEKTLFFCAIWWHGGCNIFDLYVARRDFCRRCWNCCKWEVKADHIYGYSDMPGNSTSAPDLAFPWKHACPGPPGQ